MVRDRMSDLLASRGNSSTFGRGFLRDVHLQIAQNKKLKELLEEVGEIRALIHLVVENVSIVKELHGNILSHTNKDMQKELEVRTCTISQTAFHVQRKLRDIGTGITIIDDFTAASAQDGSTYTRIKILQYTTMLQLFSEVMNDYNTSLLKYHDKCLLLLQQQRSLLRRQVTSTELDHLLDTEGASLFVDNGEQVNNIEYFANKTTNNIDGGRTQLKKAEHKSHTCRKWKIKITIIVIIVIFLLLIIASFNTAR
ncbi:syntaxin-1B isoform X2 [Ooceraea biroi]|uniref:syntaxin-1B isoform X2 n=1 Tax=Ooceraea biroi TaxID=2015173 RepID=UPI0005BBE72D|nr:syntaxin-1B isoform X2 [Ooceraea biroi]